MIDKLKQFYKFVKSVRWEMINYVLHIPEVQGLLFSLGITFILGIIVVIIVVLKMI